MNVAEVVINLIVKQTIIIKREGDIRTIFSGFGYPHSYGFFKDGFKDDDWISAFAKESSFYKVMDRTYTKRSITAKTERTNSMLDRLKDKGYI